MVQQTATAQGPMAPVYPDDQYMGWNESTMNGVSAYPEGPLYDTDVLSSIQNGAYADAHRLPTDQVSSTQLVRRPNNHQLATREVGYGHLSQNGWQEEEEDLEALALKAKKEAQAKRKQIPPFVQKLSSFLDNSNHTDLIRWSDDGNSFVVLDEDEFAKTLIPELFKHNNYASFVRQLNMYGFHKKVGLSDNSMKQAERRDKKTPSEYFNKYFKRGRPELLWLIQKPKNPQSGAKRKRDEDKKPESDEEGRKLEGDGIDSHGPEMQLIPKTEYNSMRNEIRQLQQQQKLISGIIQQMRRQNEQWFQQASQFQKMHERHENSINAILTFLATFYNRSLEGQSGVNLNIADMFPQSISQTNPNQGSVVDMGDFQEVEMPKNAPGPRHNKRPLALLPPPAATDKSPSPRITPANGSSRPSASPKSQPARTPSFYKQQQQQQQQQHGSRLSASPQTPLETQFSSATASPAIKAETPPSLHVPGTSDDMMSVINSVNASSNTPNGPQFDFPAALSHFQTADGNTPLTQQQREDMLSLMNAASPGLNAGQNNALMNPNPPPLPSLEHFGAHQEQLDVLQRLQEEQNARVQSLSDRLAPMSPHGAIPGVASYDTSLNGQGNAPPSDFDLDSYIHTEPDNYFGDTTASNGTSNFNPLPNDENPDFDFGSFGADLGAQNQDGSLFGTESPSDVMQSGGGVVESIPSEGATPSDETDAMNADKEPTAVSKSPRKKRKTG